MRFGSRSHDIDREDIDAKTGDERARLATLLRSLADRLEHASKDRIAEAMPLVHALERALKTDRSKK